MTDSILNKLATIDHCLKRIREVYDLAKEQLDTNLTSQDSIIFNLHRVCQASVDIANCFNKTLFSKFPKDIQLSF